MAPLLTDGFIPGTSRTSHSKLLPRRRICQKLRLGLYVDTVLSKGTGPDHPTNSSKDLLSLQFTLGGVNKLADCKARAIFLTGKAR